MNDSESRENQDFSELSGGTRGLVFNETKPARQQKWTLVPLYPGSSANNMTGIHFRSERTAIIQFAGENIFSRWSLEWDLTTNWWRPWYPPVHYCSFCPPFSHLISLEHVCRTFFFQYRPPWTRLLTPTLSVQPEEVILKTNVDSQKTRTFGVELTGGLPACKWTHCMPGGTLISAFLASDLTHQIHRFRRFRWRSNWFVPVCGHN